MNEDIFSRHQTDYESIRLLVRAVVRSIAGDFACSEILEELNGEGWILALEMMESYESERGCKLSTYLWQQLSWRLKRYYFAMLNRCDSDPLSDENNNVRLSTESVPNSSIYEGNPYIMSPETVYEKRERAEIWKKMKEECTSKIERCLASPPPNAGSHVRTRLWRIKQRDLARLRISLQKMIT